MDSLAKITYVNLRETNRQLERIADCLEVLLRYQFGVNMTAVKVDKSGDDPEVAYTDQDEYTANEVLEILQQRGKLEVDPMAPRLRQQDS